MAVSSQRLHPVPVEFLRPGPPHNHLLSRLTTYLVLCGNLGAESVNVPFDHAEYERRLEVLQYRLGASAAGQSQRLAQLDELGEAMARMLGAVPGLPPALADAVANQSDMAHLRLVLTPNELALLPFECAFVPKAVPGGEGQRLLLQSAAPVTLTREVRGVPPPVMTWPVEPRVLFAWAAPAGVGRVPVEAHVLALREALTPWINAYRGPRASTPPEQRERERRDRARQTAGHLTVLSEASIEDIVQACAGTAYTHVHILAHGIPTDEQATRQRVGLALHDHRRRDQLDVVDGPRLANAFRFGTPGGSGQPNLPAVITIASCDSGQVRSVVTHGGSLAHALHVAGIPLVVASQFPLSADGSVILTEELYGRLLRAEDPRTALHQVRRRLYSQFTDYHDWASLVAYAALPRDLERQLARNQFRVAKRTIGLLLEEADTLIDAIAVVPRRAQRTQAFEATKADEQLRSILHRLDRPLAELRDRGEDTTEAVGLCASAEKRRGEILFWASHLPATTVGSARDRLEFDSLEALRRARELYGNGMRQSLSSHWLGVQYVSLTRYLIRRGRLPAESTDDLWTAAKAAAEIDLARPDARVWAHGSLAELHLLRAADDPLAVDRAREHIRAMLALVERNSFEVYSTRRQFERYADWLGEALGLGGHAEALLAEFPPPEAFDRFEW